MLLRFAFVSLVCLFAANAQAQLPSSRFSPVNYFGRYHGFGYSDGYHACKDGNCSRPSWSPFGSMSTFYGAPSAPPTRVPVFVPPMSYAPSYSTGYAEAIDYGTANQGTIAPTPAPVPVPVPMPMPAPQSTSAPSLYELVPPAPMKGVSPSDRDRLDLSPSNGPETISPAPSVQSRRTPPGSQSLIKQSMFRLR